MPTESLTVILDTRTVGQGFGTVGFVRDAKTRVKLIHAETIRPYGFTDAALLDAAEIAAAHGWTVRVLA